LLVQLDFLTNDKGKTLLVTSMPIFRFSPRSSYRTEKSGRTC
jgi:hypothetical protein